MESLRKECERATQDSRCVATTQGRGWQQVGQTGSHRQFKHPTLPGRVTVAGKPGDDVAPGTLASILKQAGIKR